MSFVTAVIISVRVTVVTAPVQPGWPDWRHNPQWYPKLAV